MNTARLALVFAWRDLRGGLRGFGVFIASLALGVAAIAGVGSIAASLRDGIAAAGQGILGGDLSFSLAQRPASVAEVAFLRSQGTVGTVVSTRAMARVAAPGPQPATLVEVKAVDGTYPLFGALVTDPALPLAAALAEKDGVFGAVVDPALLSRLDVKPGARLAIGNGTVEVRAALINEPDKLSDGIGFGPRVLISTAALAATGLIAPGSLARWQYRLRLPAGASASAVAAVAHKAQTEFADAEIRSRDNASPRLARSVGRFMQFLTLVALTTLAVGGIGVANAVAAHLARKRDAIGTMKALGATGTAVFAIYGAEIMLVALGAAALGAALGAALPFLVARWLGAIIPLPVAPSLYPATLLLAVAYGLLTALVFALWPLGRAHDVPVAMLFRDQVAAQRRWPRLRYIAASALSVAAFAGLAVLTTSDHRIAAIFVAAAAAVLVLLRLFAHLAMAAARRAPRARSTALRLAVANTHRPGALTPTVMLSLGLGIALLTTVIEIDGNLHREFTLGLPRHAPSFFLVDIPAADARRFDGFVRDAAPGARLERVPMLRGRIVAANGIKASDLKPAARSRWVLEGDRGITYAAAVPPGSRVVEGRWWPADYRGAPLVSLEQKSAHDLDLKVGDTIAVNVLGRDIVARIANLRAVDWDNLGINFVMVFSPGAFAGAPHSDIATLTFADGGSPAREAAFVAALARAFPTVSAVGVKGALEAIGAIIGNLVLALRGASTLTLVAAAVVLGGALAASQHFRIYDAVVLKTFGATRARLVCAYAIEHALVGLAAVVFGLGIGTLAAGLIVERVMGFAFVLVAAPAALAAGAALLVTLLFGLAGTFTALGRKPSAVLRNL